MQADREKEKLVLTVSHVCLLASEEAEKEEEDGAKKFLTYSPDGHTQAEGKRE